MPRRTITEEDRGRAERLGAALGKSKEARQLSVQDIADGSGLGYETVRSLLLGRSAGPSFFLVADIARALSLNLNRLAEETR